MSLWKLTLISLFSFQAYASPLFEDNPLLADDPLNTGNENVTNKATEEYVEQVTQGDTGKSLKDLLDIDKIIGKVKEKIAEHTFTLDRDLIDLDLYDGIRLATRYKYQVEPTSGKKYYLRTDTYKLNTSINPGDIIEDLPFNINIAQNSEVIYHRLFKKQLNALKALPYTFKHLPVTAQRVDEHLQPGDMVTFPARLSLAMGKSAMISEGVIAFKFATNLLLRGEYLITVFKMPYNQVRLRIVALDEKNSSGTVAANPIPFELYAFKVLGKKIDKIINIRLANLGISKQNGKTYFADYIFDLHDPDARRAYDQILSSTLKFKKDALRSIDDMPTSIAENPIADISLAEELFVEDYLNRSLFKRVQRLFAGDHEYTRLNANFQMSMDKVFFNKGASYTENMFRFSNNADDFRYFFYPTYNKSVRFKFFDLIDYTSNWSAYAVYHADKEREVKKIEDFGISMSTKDKIFRGSEEDALKQWARFNIPEKLFNQIDWKNWNEDEKGWIKEASFSHQFILRASTFAKIKKYTREQLEEEFQNYADTFAGLDEDWPDQIKRSYPIQKNIMLDSLYEIAQNHTRAGIDLKKAKLFMALTLNRVFKNVGVGYMLYLIRSNDLSKDFNFGLTWNAKDRDQVSFTFGDKLNDQTIYPYLSKLMQGLNQRAFNLNLLTSSQN